MENPRPEKVAVVDEVRDKLSSSGATLITEYRGLNVKDLAALRASVRQEGAEYKVYKNTLVRFAARELQLDVDHLLTGPTALAFIDGDPAVVAKTLRDFAEANDALLVKGGLLGGRHLSDDDIRALAELPSRGQLLAELAGLFSTPLTQFAGLLDAVPRDFTFALQALIDAQGPEEGDAVSSPQTKPDNGGPTTAGADSTNNPTTEES